MRPRKIIFAIALSVGFLGISANAARGEEAQIDTHPFAPPTYEYSRLMSQQPADYWQQVGVNAVIVGDYPNALAALNKAVDLASASEPELLEQRGWVHYRLGNEQLASADLRTAAALYLADQSYEDYLNSRNMLLFVDS
ncbi:MAG: hypothetical protein AAF959_00425 [Cyanobacteria bacterium P01_D01_bin.56]